MSQNNIVINEELLKEVKKYAEHKQISLEEATKLLLEEGIKQLVPSTCNICKELFEKRFLEICDNCRKVVHCGYSLIRYHSSWERETWSEEPSICCFICYIDIALEEEVITDITEYQKELIDFIEENVSEFGAESRYSNSVTSMIVDYSEINDPRCWENIDKYIKQYADILSDTEDDEK